jgi:hypothetical protein
MLISDCCGAVAEETSEGIGICPECLEYCGFIDEEYDEYLNKLDDDYYHPFVDEE